jgi:hypothetical protein
VAERKMKGVRKEDERIYEKEVESSWEKVR